MRVMVLGIRGIPSVQGGVETHAEQLYERLARLGCQVEVVVRTPFVPASLRSFGSIRIRRIWSPRRSGFETLIHSILGVLYAGVTRPDLLHIHAIGPAIVTPLARLLGLRVVVTNHGPDYDRDKWGPVARLVLRTGERLGMRWANARIAISHVIEQLVLEKYGRDSDLIPNGAVPVTALADHSLIDRLGLQRRRYFVHVGRIVPEKRQLDLIAAFARAVFLVGSWYWSAPAAALICRQWSKRRGKQASSWQASSAAPPLRSCIRMQAALSCPPLTRDCPSCCWRH